LSAPFAACAVALTVLGFVPPVSGQSVAAPPVAVDPTPAPDPAPLSGTGRIVWITKSTIGPQSLMAGVLSAGYGTAVHAPEEYSADWKGFAARYGMRLTGVSLSNAIEGGLGAVWDEEPRYPRSGQGGFWQRVGHALQLSVMAPRPGGRLRPAYARYSGVIGSNVISTAWRVPSARSAADIAGRSALGVTGRMGGNLFEEFWPDVWKRIH
jgi:hypothetical protein